MNYSNSVLVAVETHQIVAHVAAEILQIEEPAEKMMTVSAAVAGTLLPMLAECYTSPVAVLAGTAVERLVLADQTRTAAAAPSPSATNNTALYKYTQSLQVPSCQI